MSDMTEQRTGPGFVPLEAFLKARLGEDQAAAQSQRDELELAGKRQILTAYERSRYGSMHLAGLEVAAKALAGIYSDHRTTGPPDHRTTIRGGGCS